MSPELLYLTNRAVLSKNWRWQRGMTVVNPVGLFRGVVVDVNNTGVLVCAPKESSSYRLLQPDELPDLTDSATVGCLTTLAGYSLIDPASVEAMVEALDRSTEDDTVKTDTVVS